MLADLDSAEANLPSITGDLSPQMPFVVFFFPFLLFFFLVGSIPGGSRGVGWRGKSIEAYFRLKLYACRRYRWGRKSPKDFYGSLIFWFMVLGFFQFIMGGY